MKFEMVSISLNSVRAPRVASTRADFNYLQPLPAGKHRLRFVNEGPDRGDTDAVYEPQVMEVHALKLSASAMELDKNGFELVHFTPREVDWDCEAEVSPAAG
jgi:hypothetical protein